MKQCTETITLFNHYTDNDTGLDRYSPTVIRGVSWYCEVASSVDASGLVSANRFTIRIPTGADFSGKKYVRPEAYEGSSKAAYFTLRQGDIIVHGNGTATSVMDIDNVDGGDFSPQSWDAYSDGDNLDGGTFKDQVTTEDLSDLLPAEMIERYGEVVTVLGVTDNRERPHGKHWKVTGK